MAEYNDLLKIIDEYSAAHELLPTGSSIIVGLSGGPDSMFLLHILFAYHQKKIITLRAAHLDHQWRENSAQDALFCKNYTAALGIECIIGTASSLPDSCKKGGSQEEIGRNMRRFFLENVKKIHQADRIALAHHAQDQEETFFIRLIRGTTLSGLCVMRPHQDDYIRPLLTINKIDILKYLKEYKIPFLEDPTNYSLQFLRNKIRHSVIDALQQCDDRFDKNFLRTIISLQKTEDYLQTLTKKFFQECSESDGISLELLATHADYMQDRIITMWLIQENVSFILTEKFLEEIKRFFNQKKSKLHQIHQQWAIRKDNTIAIIEKTL